MNWAPPPPPLPACMIELQRKAIKEKHPNPPPPNKKADSYGAKTGGRSSTVRGQI